MVKITPQQAGQAGLTFVAACAAYSLTGIAFKSDLIQIVAKCAGAAAAGAFVAQKSGLISVKDLAQRVTAASPIEQATVSSVASKALAGITNIFKTCVDKAYQLFGKK